MVDRQNERLSKYLIAAKDASTNVFEFKGNTIDVVANPIFSSHETTVCIEKLKNGEIIAQACFYILFL
jgi:hypothetical protein